MSDVNQWLLSLPEDENRHVLSLDKWRLADKVWDVALCSVAPKWIPVSERLPEPGEPVVYARPDSHRHGRYQVGIAYWTVSKKWNPEMESSYAPEGFTHWMPLPEPPKG